MAAVALRQGTSQLNIGCPHTQLGTKGRGLSAREEIQIDPKRFLRL